MQGADGLYCLLTDTVNDELLDAAGPGLRVVATMSVGYDHMSTWLRCVNGASYWGIHRVSSPKRPRSWQWRLLLATARRLPEGTHAVESGTWPIWRPMWMTGRDIHGSTVGIVGLGRIGAAFARMLGGFGCRILYTGPREKPEEARAVNATFAPMDALLQESDFVAVHCPLNEHTRALFSTEAFGKMKASAALINTSRGGVVDQDALYQALVQGEIAAAGLDVTDPEPLPADHPLVSLENCVILPHIGSATVATRTKMAVMTTENLLAGVEGRPLPNQVEL